MKFFELILIIEIVYLVDFYEASLHTWGARGYNDKNKLIDMKLIEHNSTTPKNYTLIYRYFQNYNEPVSYIEINVTSESNGSITQSTSQQYYYGNFLELLIFDAYIHINNTTNVLASLTIYERDYTPFMYVLQGIPENNKSVTFLYMKDVFPQPRPYALSSIGKRQTGDELLYFESRNVTTYNRFPCRTFSYNSDEEYLTYVRFSLTSPTAIVLVNMSFVGEREFNAVAYDMNSERFGVSFSVFGIKSASRPNGFLGILDVQT